MLHKYHGKPEFLVELFKRLQKRRCGNGVELRSRLVQQHHIGIGHKHRSKVKQLFFTAGQLASTFAVDVRKPQKAANFRNATADNVARLAKAFQPESQLVPHLVRYDLVVGVLHNKPYCRCRRAVVEFGNIRAAKRYTARTLTDRGKRRL